MRLWYLGEARERFDFERPVVDAGYHDYWAWEMVSGEATLPLGAQVDPEIASTPYFRPPLPAYWLAALFALFGHDHLMARLVQVLLGTASCLVVWRLATRLFDGATGLVAGLLAATYWILVYFDLEYREVTLLVFLYATFALLLLRWKERPSVGPAALAGAVLGLSVLARPNGLLLAPVVLAWGWWSTRPEPPPRALRQAGAFLLAVALCVLPVTLRNLIASGQLVLVSSNGGINLFIGNNPHATGTAIALPPEIPTFDSAFDYPEIVRKVGELEGRTLSHAEVSRWFTERALAHMSEHPLRTLRLVAKKAAAFWGGREIVSEKDLVAARRASTALGAVPLDVSAVIVTALLGLVLCAARWRHANREGTVDREGLVLVLALLGTYFVSFLPFFVTARFRAPIVPFLLVLSAFALRELARLARARRLGIVAVAVAALAFAYLLHRPSAGDEPEQARNVAADLAAEGAHLASMGRLEEAEEVLRRAVAADPAYPMARNNLGLLLSHLGRSEEAIEHLRAAVELDPSDHRPHQNLALALLDVGELDVALLHFERAAELAPLNPALPLEAGQALFAAGHPRLAMLRLERARDLDPGEPMAHLLLGLASLRLGRASDAIAPLEEAARLAPDDERIAVALREARRAAAQERNGR